MKPKDHVVRAVGQIAEVLTILTRINYDNAEQQNHNMQASAKKLRLAAAWLDKRDTAS